MIQDLAHSLDSIDALASFVHHRLCEKENLLRDQFLLQQATLMSKGRPCGLQFSLHGPRSIRLGAIWAADQNCIFFYDTRGERFLKVKLTCRIPFEVKAAG